MTFTEILEFNFINFGKVQLNLFQVLMLILVLVIARTLLWVVNRILTRYFRKRNVDPGRRYAVVQFVKYILYTTAILMALESLGISISLLIGGAAALLVGIGLGLQQTFNDLVSGIILLIEGSVSVKDVVEVDGVVGYVTSIGIRTSQVETRDRVSIVIPNSKLVGDKAINWSHNQEPTRFQVNVGVAYSSDVELVTKLLTQAAEEHELILKNPPPRVQFKDFGNSSLDFVLHFFTTELLPVEFIKSDLRYRITQLFRHHHVEIPFPQNDIWLRNYPPPVQVEEKGKEEKEG